MRQGTVSHYAEQRKLQAQVQDKASSAQSLELDSLKKQLLELRTQLSGGLEADQLPDALLSEVGEELRRLRRQNSELERENRALRQRSDLSPHGSPTGAAAMREIVNDLRKKLARSENEVGAFAPSVGCVAGWATPEYNTPV